MGLIACVCGFVLVVAATLGAPLRSDAVEVDFDRRVAQKSTRRKQPAELDACFTDPHHVEARFFKNESECVRMSTARRKLIEMVHFVGSVFAAAKIDYWLDGGTLLGQVRNKRIIPYDLDGDFGMLSASLNRLRQLDLRDELAPTYILEITNSTFYDVGSRADALPARIIDVTVGLYVDIFEYPIEVILGREFLSPVPSICWWMCARCIHDPTTGFKKLVVPAFWFRPTRVCQFEGQSMRCPHMPDPYLRHLYGDDYMTPKKFY